MMSDNALSGGHEKKMPAVDEEFLKSILESVLDGITALTTDGMFIYANDAAARLLGVESAEELQRMSPRDILHHYDMFTEEGAPYEFQNTPTRRALQGERVAGSIMRFRLKATGEERWAMVSAQPVLDGGKVQYAITIFRDITEERRVQQGLHENEQRSRFLAEVSASLTSSMEYVETLKTLANRMVPFMADWCAIDMLSEEEQLVRLAVVHTDPKKVEFAYEVHRKYPYDPRSQTGVANVMRTGKVQFVPEITDEMLRANAKDEEHFSLIHQLGVRSAMIVPLIARSKTLGVLTLIMSESDRRYDAHDVAFVEDIAHRAALAVDNALLYKDAQDALALRDDFLSIASHELKTPVTSIKAFLQALEHRMHDPAKFDFEKNRQYMSLSVKQVDRLALIINDLLDINRINKGRMNYQFKALPIGPVLSDAIERMSVSFPDHKLHMKLGDLTTMVMIDELRFEQVLTNLITNAAKYSPEGSTIDIITRSDERSISIDIIDRGIGISEEDQELIFTRYYRTAEAVNARVSGLGVGLFISHELIKAHRGSLAVKSHLGEGSTFTITLPRAENSHLEESA